MRKNPPRVRHDGMGATEFEIAYPGVTAEDGRYNNQADMGDFGLSTRPTNLGDENQGDNGLGR